MSDTSGDMDSAARATSGVTQASAMPEKCAPGDDSEMAIEERPEIQDHGIKRNMTASGESLPASKRGAHLSSAEPFIDEQSGLRLARCTDDPALTEQLETNDRSSHAQSSKSKSNGTAPARKHCIICWSARAATREPEQDVPEEVMERFSQFCHREISAMDSDRAEFENMVNILSRKMAHIIVESRLGKKINTPCKVHADVPDWFNLSLDDMPEVVKEVKRLLASSGGFWNPAAPVTSFCVEISLKTADGVPLVLEQWSLTIDASAAIGAKPPAIIVNQLGVLLKSLLVTTRLTVGYRLSRQQSPESHIIFYKIYIGEPDLSALGEASEKMMIGEVGTPICTVNLSVHSRTKLTISTHSSDPIVMKSDHFKPEQSPRVRRVTGLAERRPRSVSDSVEMIGASSSSSSNMDTKTTGGSSTDSDQRRRVAAFADDPAERSAPAPEVPFLRLLGEPSPPAAAATDVSMADGSAAQQQQQRRVVSDVPRPVAAAAAATGVVSSSPPAGDFVMRTPFSETSSDSELGAFFRPVQVAQTLPSATGQQGPPGTAAAAVSSPPADRQVMTITEQLARFEVQADEFDDMIEELDRDAAANSKQ